MVTFHKFGMSKRKNLDSWGGGRAPGTPSSRFANAKDVILWLVNFKVMFKYDLYHTVRILS